MTTALDKLRGMAGAARRDSLIATAEADILDRLVRVAEDEDDERLDGALEELGDNLRRALDRCVDRDATDDDIPSTGCPTCDAVLDTLAECHGMSLRGTTSAEVAVSARDWIGDLIVERNEARSEVERLRAGVAALRERPTRDELADYARRIRSGEVDDAPEADEPDDGWEPVLQWNVNEHGQRVVVNSSGHTVAWVDDYGDRPGCFRAGVLVDSLKSPWRSRDDCTDRSAAMRWCEQQPEVADVIAAYTSAPTVGATDAGPDVPAQIVEGDAAEGAPLEGAVPAAPVSTAEQRDGETGVDRPRVDSRERNEADR